MPRARRTLVVTKTRESPWGAKPRRRASQFPMKREAVLSAAAALIGRSGYNGMSLSDLASELNVTKPTLYHYVGSKEELFSEIVARSQRMTIEFMKSVVQQATTGYNKLRQIMLGYAEIVNSDFGTCLIFANSPELGAKTRAEIRQRAREANALILQALDEGAQDGTLIVDDRTIVLQTLFGALNWSPNWFKSDGRLPLKAVAERQIDILLNGVRGPKAKRK
jgi:AcrR family transcriptional regulator